jgi:hypothetical protein
MATASPGPRKQQKKKRKTKITHTPWSTKIDNSTKYYQKIRKMAKYCLKKHENSKFPADRENSSIRTTWSVHDLDAGASATYYVLA